MTSSFDLLSKEHEDFRKLSQQRGCNGFLGQEALRFYSVAGTLRDVDGFALDETALLDERYLTHILSRSLLENYFCILYLFDEPTESANRYDRILNGFKSGYRKLMNETELPFKSELEPAEQNWSSLQPAPNVKTMLDQIRNDYGDRLGYLYFVYRITSFDVHGKSMSNLFEAAFAKKGNFPVLKIERVIELIASEYVSVLADLKKRGEV